MATACIPQITFGFEPKGKPIVAAFDLPHASSDGGAVLHGPFDDNSSGSTVFVRVLPRRAITGGSRAELTITAMSGSDRAAPAATGVSRPRDDAQLSAQVLMNSGREDGA